MHARLDKHLEKASRRPRKLLRVSEVGNAQNIYNYSLLQSLLILSVIHQCKIKAAFWAVQFAGTSNLHTRPAPALPLPLVLLLIILVLPVLLLH